MGSVFARKASGLVRSVGSRDVFIYNLGIINLGIGLSYILRYGLPFYPGADLGLATVFVCALCTVQALVYYFACVVFPRSGAEYVFISRSLHPALGFAFSFSTTVWLLWYTAWSAANFASLGLASLLTILGLRGGYTGLESASVWLQSPWGMFIVGTILLIAMTLVFIVGMQVYLRVQRWSFVLAMLGIAAMFYVLLTTSRQDFVASFNSIAQSSIGSGAYQKVLDVARAAGLRSRGFSWAATIAVMVWPLYPLAYSFESSSFGGEIRRIEHSQLVGMPGAVLFAGGIFLGLIALANRVMGHDFLAAIGYNASNAVEGSLAVTPWFHLLTSMSTSSIIPVLLINVGFAVWTLFWVGGDLMYATRTVFAWAIDRIVPGGLAAVDSRFWTPVNSIVACTIFTEICLGLYTFTTWFTDLVGTLAIVLTFLLMGVSAIVIPVTQPDIFRNSPVARYRIGRMPLVTGLGVVTTAFMVLMAYLLFIDETASGPRMTAIVSVLLPLALGFLYFFAAKAVQRKRGIDVSLAYKQIPVE